MEFAVKYFERLNGGEVYSEGQSHRTEKHATKEYINSLYQSIGQTSEKNQRIRLKGTLTVNIVRGMHMLIDE